MKMYDNQEMMAATDLVENATKDQNQIKCFSKYLGSYCWNILDSAWLQGS